MNRQILFRGKRLDNGEWVYGDLEYNRKKNIARIHTYDEGGEYLMQHLVEPESVGQYTGLLDKNGKEIYESDIVMQRGYSGVKPMVVRFEQGAFIVGWHGGSSTQTRPMLIQKRCEVIGNVIDNPDLLNGK